MGAIYILWLRQLKRYVRTRARVIGSLGQPLLYLLALGFGFGPMFQKAGGGDYIQFLAPGIIAMGIMFTGMFSGIEILWDRQFGFLRETLVAPVPRLNIVLGRTLGGATIAVLQGALIFAICLVVGFRVESLARLPAAAAFMILISVAFTAVGTVFGSWLEDYQAFPVIMNFFVMPLFFFSGAIFPLEGLPRGLRAVMVMNPLSYGVDGLRGALTHGFAFGLGTDFLVLGLATAAMLALGSFVFSKIQL
jgi:ABC-2 type transport system permease protein